MIIYFQLRVNRIADDFYLQPQILSVRQRRTRMFCFTNGKHNFYSFWPGWRLKLIFGSGYFAWIEFIRNKNTHLLFKKQYYKKKRLKFWKHLEIIIFILVSKVTCSHEHALLRKMWLHSDVARNVYICMYIKRMANDLF